MIFAIFSIAVSIERIPPKRTYSTDGSNIQNDSGFGLAAVDKEIK